jgi:phosphate starvation-inducible PhoH-like protein
MRIGAVLCFLLTPKQEQFQKTFSLYPIHILMGPAGTGKTLLSVQEAVRCMQQKKTKKIVLTRPLKTIDREDIGHLPGSINDKLQPWIAPAMHYLREHYTPAEIQDLIKKNRLEISPLGFMRGRTFDDTVLIADEMQNSNIVQMKMLLTRLGRNSRIIITGDPDQSDIPGENGLSFLVERLSAVYPTTKEMNRDGFQRIELDASDIRRHPMIPTILGLFKNADKA